MTDITVSFLYQHEGTGANKPDLGAIIQVTEYRPNHSYAPPSRLAVAHVLGWPSTPERFAEMFREQWDETENQKRSQRGPYVWTLDVQKAQQSFPTWWPDLRPDQVITVQWTDLATCLENRRRNGPGRYWNSTDDPI